MKAAITRVVIALLVALTLVGVTPAQATWTWEYCEWLVFPWLARCYSADFPAYCDFYYTPSGEEVFCYSENTGW